MLRKIVLTARADGEIDEACDWYEACEPGLEEEFLRFLGKAFDAVAEHPEFYPIRFGTIRRIILKKFPYAVYYRHDEGMILIEAVFHEARDPSRLKF